MKRPRIEYVPEMDDAARSIAYVVRASDYEAMRVELVAQRDRAWAVVPQAVLMGTLLGLALATDVIGLLTHDDVLVYAGCAGILAANVLTVCKGRLQQPIRWRHRR